MATIKTMKLYRHPERIYTDLEQHGYEQGNKLSQELLSNFDQYHYFGTQSVDDAISALNIEPSTSVLEIGSGLGGPARHLAAKASCLVTALELQKDIHALAETLTKDCRLSDLVEHIHGDILTYTGHSGEFDHLVSWLAILHIPQRQTLLQNCHDLLKPGGTLFFEDFYKISEFSESELVSLSKDVYCDYLPTLEEYRDQLSSGGFNEIQFTDMTKSWTRFVNERLDAFKQSRSQYESLHGNEVAENLEDFFRKMSLLFNNGDLGGLRITARKS